MNLKKLLTPVVLGLGIFLGSLLPSRANAQYIENVFPTDMGKPLIGIVYNQKDNSLGLTSEYNFGTFSCDSNKIISKIKLGVKVSSRPVYDSADNKTYCGFVHDSLFNYDYSSNLEKKIRIDDGVYSICLGINKNRLYTSGRGGVSIIDCQTDSLLDYIPCTSPGQVSVNPSEEKMYAQCPGDLDVKIIDLKNNGIIKTIQTGLTSRPIGCFCKSADKYYTFGNDSSESCIQVISGTTNSVIKKLPLIHGYVPSSFLEMSNNNLLCGIRWEGTATVESESIFVINTSSDSIISKLYAGDRNPARLIQSSETGLIYVGKTSTGTNIMVLDSTGTSIIKTLRIGGRVTGLASGNGRVYAIDYDNDSLYVIKEPTGIEEQNPVPEKKRTLVYPNPSKGNVSISFSGPVQQSEDVSVVNLEGKVVSTLFPSSQEFHWNGFDANSRNVPAGVYFVRRKSGEMVKVVRSR